MTPKRMARPGWSSVFTLPTSTLPSYFRARPSITGESILQGPHQEAQKSTMDSPLAVALSNASSVR